MVGADADRRALERGAARLEQPRIKYRDLLEGVGAGIYAIDLEGRFIYVNAQALALLGYGPNEAGQLIGEHFGKILSPEAASVAQELFTGFRQVRPPVMQVLRKDGTSVSVEVSGAWVRRRGRRVGALAMAWEVLPAPAVVSEQARELSKLDLTILQLLADGMSNREIAERVYLSIHTIKDRIEKIMRLFGVTRRAELAAKAARQGLV
jgi:PAS domain S-box-containing protein